MKLLVIGDLHGRKPIVKTKDFDAIILVGDICDDRKIGPLYKKYFQLLKDLDFEISFADFVANEIGEKNIVRYEKESLQVGNKILRYLDSFQKPIFMVAGNWDQSYGKTRIKEEDVDKSSYTRLKYFFESWMGDKINLKLSKGVKNLKNCMFNCVEFNGVNFVGYGLSSGPERVRKKYRKEVGEKKFNHLKSLQKKLINKLDYAYRNRRNKKLPTIFISHNIPYNTKLDMIKDKKSYAYKKHLGSIIARNFCNKYKPELCFGGHIHEGKGRDKIGKTIVINPGYGANAQVMIDFDENIHKIKKVIFLKQNIH